MVLPHVADKVEDALSRVGYVELVLVNTVRRKCEIVRIHLPTH